MVLLEVATGPVSGSRCRADRPRSSLGQGDPATGPAAGAPRPRQNAVTLPLGLLPIAVLLVSQGLPEPAAFSSFPAAVVLAAGWLLRCRLLMAVLGVAWATQV